MEKLWEKYGGKRGAKQRKKQKKANHATPWLGIGGRGFPGHSRKSRLICGACDSVSAVQPRRAYTHMFFFIGCRAPFQVERVNHGEPSVAHRQCHLHHRGVEMHVWSLAPVKMSGTRPPPGSIGHTGLSDQNRIFISTWKSHAVSLIERMQLSRLTTSG